MTSDKEWNEKVERRKDMWMDKEPILGGSLRIPMYVEAEKGNRVFKRLAPAYDWLTDVVHQIRFERQILREEAAEALRVDQVPQRARWIVKILAGKEYG